MTEGSLFNHFHSLVLGGCQCACSSHSQYFQCVACVSHLLAYLRHHGSPNVCREVL